MAAYYNENDPYAAQWLRNLIAKGHIAPGEVDERSISDVHPGDLKEFTQCHFFAGIGVWSYALRKAGWPDDRRVWTGSCPCQPFSAAGQGAGFTDERHLWPHWHHLLAERRPPVVFGEQVASKDAEPWIDLVSLDLEGLGYAVGATAYPAAGVGAPHIRDRLYWMAYADDEGPQGRGMRGSGRTVECAAGAGGVAVRLADTDSTGSLSSAQAGVHRGEEGARARDGEPERHRTVVRLADPERHGLHRARRDAAESSSNGSADGLPVGGGEGLRGARTGPTNGFWRDSDWLLCRDGKWRPVRPGTQPLVDGTPARVGRLRAYGNAINAEQAENFIRCAMGAMTDMTL